MVFLLEGYCTKFNDTGKQHTLFWVPVLLFIAGISFNAKNKALSVNVYSIQGNGLKMGKSSGIVSHDSRV